MCSSAIRSSSPVADPGLDLLADVRDRLGDDAAGSGHLLDLLRRLADDHLAPTVSKAPCDLCEDVLDRPARVQRHELACRPVVLDDRLGLLVVDREPAADRLRRVVGPSLLVGTAERARPRRLVVEVEEEDHVEPAADLAQHLVERLGLREVAREAVEDEPVERVVLGQPLADHPDRDLVGDEVAALHDRVDLAPERRRVVERAEHVAGRDVRDLVLGRDALRLRSLPRPLRAEHEHVHRWPAW